MGQIGTVLTTPDGARELLGLDQPEPSSVVKAELEKAWQQLGPVFQSAGVSEADFNAALFGKLRDDFPAMFAEILEPLEATLSTMMTSLPVAAADAQRKSLTTDLSPPIRVKLLSAFQWRVFDPGFQLILPDCIAIGYGHEGAAAPLILAEMETVASIFAPLSSTRLSIGSAATAAVPSPDLNDDLAGCSWDFFVASHRTDALEQTRAKLRTRVSQFLAETVDTAVAEAFRDRPEKKIICDSMPSPPREN